MERYKVWMLKCGSFMYWTGRSWDARPYNVKCYATKQRADEAMPAALKKTSELVTVVEGTLELPR